tara:strand:+ start:283 stop:1134 length:852 start_codon:yes stop_codon:yes gene_type:complete
MNPNSKNSLNKDLLVSCVFGVKFSKLHPALFNYRCVLFSNNIKLKKEALKKGWEFEFVDKFELSKDHFLSSLQSKYIKFLQFLDDFPAYKKYRSITYIDHTIKISKEESKRLKGLFHRNKKIFMISSAKGYLATESLDKASKSHQRYRNSYKQTKDWINYQLDHKNIPSPPQEYATGFIMYKDFKQLMPFLKNVYATIWDLRQPHCQTIWAVLVQWHLEDLQYIYWSDTSMKKRTPLPFDQDIKRFIRENLRSILKPSLEFFGIDYEKFRKEYVLKLFGAGIR